MKTFRLVVIAVLLPFCGAASAYQPGHRAGAALPEEVTRLLIAELCRHGCSGEEVARWKRGVKAERYDLDADGRPEFFVHVEHGDWCGAGANCTYWVFQKRGRGYALLLKDKVLRVRGGVSHGYRDLASETPMGFCGRNVQRLDVTPYRFDGERYRAQPRRTECRAFTTPAVR